MITKTFDLQVGSSATVKLRPVTAGGIVVSVDNILFVSSDPANCPIVVDAADPNTFHLGPLASLVDVDFTLTCDGHLGDLPGVDTDPLTDVLHCHGVAPDAVDVQFNVTVDATPVVPPVVVPPTATGTVTNADGSITTTFSDGSTSTVAVDGTITTTPPTPAS